MTALLEAPVVQNIAERCDRCGHRSYVETKTHTGDTFSWCGHHYVKLWAPIFGETIVDIRGQLLIKETGDHA